MEDEDPLPLGTEEVWQRSFGKKGPRSEALRYRSFDYERDMALLSLDIIISSGAPKRIMKSKAGNKPNGVESAAQATDCS
ncbi:hypothetical protein GGR54DRAFT_635658 [Hypoxylon sp. NC1633]|nr:hypothetical protein GGR54DRAFT_635658 [Hypoxylon sp. NC1633]